MYEGVTLLASQSVSSNAATLTTSPLTRGTHNVNIVYSGDSNYLTSSLPMQLTVLANVSLAIEARALPNAIAIYAVVPADTTSATLMRRVAGPSTFSPVANWTISSEIDSSPTTRGLQYEYRLDIVRNNVTPDSSNIDSAILFTDDTALTGTAVKLIHFNELRTAVNAMRTAGGLAPFNFDGTFGASALIRASHITALRTAATEARNALGLFPIAFTGSISAGTVIHATDVTELRDAVR